VIHLEAHRSLAPLAGARVSRAQDRLAGPARSPCHRLGKRASFRIAFIPPRGSRVGPRRVVRRCAKSGPPSSAYRLPGSLPSPRGSSAAREIEQDAVLVGGPRRCRPLREERGAPRSLRRPKAGATRRREARVRNHLNPTGTSGHFAPVAVRHPIDHRARDQRLFRPCAEGCQPGPMLEQENRSAHPTEKWFRVEQGPAAGRHDPRGDRPSVVVCRRPKIVAIAPGARQVSPSHTATSSPYGSCRRGRAA